MKTLAYILLILIPCNLKAQEIQLLEPNGVQKKIVITDYYFPNGNTLLGDTTKVLYYNANGKIDRTQLYTEGLIHSLATYQYEENQLVKYIDYGRRNIEYLAEYGSNEKSIYSDLDTSIIVEIKNYEYSNGQLKQIETLEFGTVVRNKQLFKYDKMGNEIEEQMTIYPAKNVIAYFEPNSAEIDNNQSERFQLVSKTCVYEKGHKDCIYYDSNGITAKESIALDSKNRVLKSEILDVNGTLIEQKKYIYNSFDKYKTFESFSNGKSPYGWQVDYIESIKVVYFYDKNEILTTEKHYSESKLFAVIHYIYEYR